LAESEEDRCRKASKFRQIDDAFRRGDLAALRATVDADAIPNGRLPDGIGSCLVYAIYHSPLAFIRELLAIGADPRAPADDGFPPLIAAIRCTRASAGGRRRTDLDEIVRLLLTSGADANQRGVNDYTPLHMAVAERNLLAVQRLLDAGADPLLRTRIDDCETPAEMARSAGLADFAELLARKGAPLKRRLRSGLTLLADVPGDGEPVRRQSNYLVRLRTWLNQGDLVKWSMPSGPAGVGGLEDGGTTLVTALRINRGQLTSGLFYGVDGMRIGGMRRLEIAPHLAYGDAGVPGVIPAQAVLVTEVTVLEELSGP
jgi:hypothetical protein